MTQIKGNPDTPIRQVAAVLLRRKIGSHLKSLPEPTQDEIKTTLLDRLVNEPERPVRLSVAALISEIAKKLVPNGKWDPLLEFLLKCSESQHGVHREIAMVLFRALADNIGDALRPHFGTLQQIFMKGLSDTEASVRLESLKALGVLAEDILDDEEVQRFSAAIPLMVNVVKQSVQDGNEEVAAVAFEAFDNLTDSSSNVLVPHLPIVVELMAEVVSNRNISVNIREKASLFIRSVCESKVGKLLKCGLIPPLLDISFQLACEPYNEDDEMTPQRMAVEILDTLAINAPKQMVYDKCIACVTALSQDADEHKRKGALVVIATATEGLAEFYKPELNKFLELTVKSTKDPSSLVRSAAANCITQFSDYLRPEIMDCHEIVIPCLFNIMDSTQETNAVKKRACGALDSFCDRLGSSIGPYVDAAMQRLGPALTGCLSAKSEDDTVNANNKEMAEHIIMAIKSIATSAADGFSPFFADTMSLMAQLMTQKTDDYLGLRSAATECVGALAAAVGKQKFDPFLQDTLKLVIEGMQLDHFQLREATHEFFRSLCVMLGPDFAPLLSTVVPLLLASCESDDGFDLEKANDAFGGQMYPSDPDEDDEEADDKRYKLIIRSGALDEKLAAVSTLGTIANVVGKPFLDYMPRALLSLDELAAYPHPFLQVTMLRTYTDFVGLLNTAFPNPVKWKPGNPATDLHPDVVETVSKLVLIYLVRLQEGDHKEVAATACDGLVECCKKFGPKAVESFVEDINEIVLELVNEQAPCQLAYGDDDPERADHDEILIDDVTNLIGVLAMMYGKDYDPLFQKVWPALMKFIAPHRPFSDRSMAIGCIAEVAEAIGEHIVKYLDQIFPIVINGLSDSAVAVRRNSAFCLGTLCMSAGPALHQHYASALTALQPLLVVPADCPKYDKEQIVATKDNAASVLAKMIRANASAVPLDQVVPALLAACPLTEDLAEAEHVYPVIIQLFSSHTQLMLSHLGAAVNAMSGALLMVDLLEPETKAQILTFCKALPGAAGDALQPAVAALPQNQQEVFMAAVRS